MTNTVLTVGYCPVSLNAKISCTCVVVTCCSLIAGYRGSELVLSQRQY